MSIKIFSFCLINLKYNADLTSEQTECRQNEAKSKFEAK